MLKKNRIFSLILLAIFLRGSFALSQISGGRTKKIPKFMLNIKKSALPNFGKSKLKKFRVRDAKKVAPVKALRFLSPLR